MPVGREPILLRMLTSGSFRTFSGIALVTLPVAITPPVVGVVGLGVGVGLGVDFSLICARLT